MGTMLPAVALGGDAGLSRAGARGSTTFFYALPRLFISIILLGGVFGGLNYYAATHYGPRLFSLSGALISNHGVPNFSKILYWSATKLYGTFQLVMTAVILSRAYMIVEGEQSTPVSTTRTDKFIRPQKSGGDFKPLFPSR